MVQSKTLGGKALFGEKVATLINLWRRRDIAHTQEGGLTKQEELTVTE